MKGMEGVMGRERIEWTGKAKRLDKNGEEVKKGENKERKKDNRGKWKGN